MSGLGVYGAICRFQSWAVRPLCFSFIIDGIWPTINTLAMRVVHTQPNEYGFGV